MSLRVGRRISCIDGAETQTKVRELREVVAGAGRTNEIAMAAGDSRQQVKGRESGKPRVVQ